MRFIYLSFHILNFKSHFHDLFVLICTVTTFLFFTLFTHKSFLKRLTIFLYLLCLLIGFDSSIQLNFQIFPSTLIDKYIVFYLSYAILMFFILVASSLIFLSFIPLPSNLVSRSNSVVSYLVHFISSWACWRTDLGLLGLGGKGVVPFLDGSRSESESESLSEKAFLMGFLYWLLLTTSSEWRRDYLFVVLLLMIVSYVVIF